MVYQSAIISTIDIQNRKKLNQLHHLLPEGLPVDSSWLQKQGYSRQLIAKYLHNGWLVSPVLGVYRRDSALLDSKDWQTVIVSLQNLLSLPITVGGRTALELQGFAHYLSMTGHREIHLYCPQSLPGWVSKLPLKQPLLLHSAHLFKLVPDRKENATDWRAHFAEHRWGASDWNITCSTPERAVLELLAELPSHETFHQADVLMEGLTSLRPRYLNILLSDCRSIKTKRLFLWFAERHNHAWFKAIDTKTVNLGSGKRMLVPGGKLDTRYLITVPKEFGDN
jgi:hypothetical protein